MPLLSPKLRRMSRNSAAAIVFLAGYSYTLGADQLTLFSEKEMVDSGVTFFNRYRSLAAASTPFFRSSGEDRVVRSAQNFTQGFHQAKIASSASAADRYPYLILVISEDPGANNTLNHGACPAFESKTKNTIGTTAP